MALRLISLMACLIFATIAMCDKNIYQLIFCFGLAVIIMLHFMIDICIKIAHGIQIAHMREFEKFFEEYEKDKKEEKTQ